MTPMVAVEAGALRHALDSRHGSHVRDRVLDRTDHVRFHAETARENTIATRFIVVARDRVVVIVDETRVARMRIAARDTWVVSRGARARVARVVGRATTACIILF